MLKRQVPRIISAVAAVLAVTTGMGTPLAASAATGTQAVARFSSSLNSAMRPGFTSGKTYRIHQRDNGLNVCLDASFEFSVCQTSKNPDDPPSLQKWVIDSTGHNTYKFWNREGTGWCLDLTQFDAPCSKGNSNQRWLPVSAGDGAYYIEHQSPGGDTCLDESWTFKACSPGDANQIWELRLVSGRSG